ncbi:MAG: SDR family oxidoreductase [Gammaproteobacteria bacterium]
MKPTIDAFLSDQATVYRRDLMAGKRILISGGGSGIGRATACLFARLGAEVVISGRKKEKLDSVVEQIREHGFLAQAIACDIREPDAVENLFSQLRRDFEPIDYLINSAGGQFPQPAIEFSEKGWMTVINTNLNGTWRMMQAAAKLWRDKQRSGGIVNIVVVPQGLHGVAHTCAARAGVMAASQAVSVEWAPLKIRVNCIAPGAIETEGWEVYDEQTRAKYPRTNPTMRAGTPWEIAESCVYLCSPAGEFVTGETITVDGGGQRWGEIWTNGKPEYFSAATRLWDDEPA